MMDELANEMEAPAEGASSVLVETLGGVGSGAVGASACTRDHVHQSGAEEDAVAWDVRAMAECDEEKEGAGEAAWAAPTTARFPTTIQRCASPVPPGGRVGNHKRFFEEGDVLVAFGVVSALSCSKGPPPKTESAFGVVGVLSGSKGRLPSASARVLCDSEDGDVVAMEAEAVEAEAMEAEEAMELEEAEVEAVDLLDDSGASAADIAAAHFAAIPENRPEEEAAEAEAEAETESMEMESGAEAEPEPMAGTCSTLEAAAAFATGSAVLTELVLAAALGSPCTVDMTKMKVEELRGALKTAGCDTSGKRAELVSRLVGWLGAAKAPATAPVVESPVDIKPGENGFVWTGQVSAR